MCKFHDPSIIGFRDTEGGVRGAPFPPPSPSSRLTKIFMFLINPPSGNVKIQKMIAKHIFECFEKRKGEDGKATLGLN